MKRFLFKKSTGVFLPSSLEENGQVLLVVVLLIVVVLTVGLSIAARSITNLRQSSDENSSQRAFSAAEAGVQIAMQDTFQGSTGTVKLNDATYQTSVTADAVQEFIVNGGEPLLPNDPVDIWLSAYPTYTDQWSGQLLIYYGDADETDPCSVAALEVVTLTGSTSSPTMTHYTADQCAGARQTPNNFSAPQTSGPYKVGGRSYKYALPITITQTSPGIIARIIPLYKSTTLAVVSGTPGDPLPVQGKIIESVGSAGETKRKIIVYQGFPKLPLELFPYTLFTPADSL